MKRVFAIGVICLAVTGCKQLNTAFTVLDVITTPTDRDICESQQIGGKWIDGQCYQPTDRACEGRIVDGVCYTPSQ